MSNGERLGKHRAQFIGKGVWIRPDEPEWNQPIIKRTGNRNSCFSSRFQHSLCQGMHFSGGMNMASRPKPTGKQLGLIIVGAVAGAVIAHLILGVGGAVGGGIIGLGAALGGMPYFRAVQEWQKNQQ
jgi:hypothetical protein